jgi:hypothetical protein
MPSAKDESQSASTSLSASTITSQLLRLPAELVAGVALHLPNHDIKNLRLTCKFLRDRALLRLNRVFLSANPRNVAVFRAIADHDAFRSGITQIVWDDAQLVGSLPDPDDHIQRQPGEGRLRWESPFPGDCPRWFARACAANLKYLGRNSKDVDRPDIVAVRQQVDALLPLGESWSYYQQLLLQQQEVLAFGDDVDALQYGLERFPMLKRITITPAAHGILFQPLYETPMIRAFPSGFNYPIPRGWPTPARGGQPYWLGPWDDESEKGKWRGFHIVTRELADARQAHSVSELIINVNYLNTGLNCRLFEQPASEDYENLVALLRRPGFSRLDLALLTEGQQDKGWSAFRNTNLRRAIGNATDLQHISLRSEVDYGLFLNTMATNTHAEHFVPSRTIFPIDKWHKLRHFGLSNFLVRLDDLLPLLVLLPRSLRSVELSFLVFLGGSGNYKDLLDEMRRTLDWRDRPAEERPRVTIHHKIGRDESRYVCMSDAASGFLYGDETNPFIQRRSANRPATAYTPGTFVSPENGRGIIRDPFLPAYDRPNVKMTTLVQMGIVERNPWLEASSPSS